MTYIQCIKHAVSISLFTEIYLFVLYYSGYTPIFNSVKELSFSICLDTCDKELVSGCEHNIPDKSITASSKYSYLYRPENARLNTM